MNPLIVQLLSRHSVGYANKSYQCFSVFITFLSLLSNLSGVEVEVGQLDEVRPHATQQRNSTIALCVEQRTKQSRAYLTRNHYFCFNLIGYWLNRMNGGQ